jgi:hypothetical protein
MFYWAKSRFHQLPAIQRPIRTVTFRAAVQTCRHWMRVRQASWKKMGCLGEKPLVSDSGIITAVASGA